MNANRTPSVEEPEQMTPVTHGDVGDSEQVIREVLKRLGTPTSLYRITATNLWQNHYRVNIYCQPPSDAAFRPVIMTDSFFVDLVENGIESQPPIVPRYGTQRGGMITAV